MPKPTNRDSDLKTLVDEIRASEGVFVEAAVKALRERIAMEYTRLRGYAIEADTETMVLDMKVTFNFARGNSSVLVESAPAFKCVSGTSRAKVVVPDAR